MGIQSRAHQTELGGGGRHTVVIRVILHHHRGFLGPRTTLAGPLGERSGPRIGIAAVGEVKPAPGGGPGRNCLCPRCLVRLPSTGVWVHVHLYAKGSHRWNLPSLPQRQQRPKLDKRRWETVEDCFLIQDDKNDVPTMAQNVFQKTFCNQANRTKKTRIVQSRQCCASSNPF